MVKHILIPPPPVFFIKSISEQGYTLSTAISDLIDNSIAAGAPRVEILLDVNTKPLQVFIADDGSGMSAEILTESMRFPSADLELYRSTSDLGRFGLGMKTASFSQARKFTVVSKLKNEQNFNEARTWDVEYLKKTGEWTLITEPDENIGKLVSQYQNLSSSFHSFENSFNPKTLIVWEQLYKLERLDSKNELNDELEELRGHLSMVFHRFIASSKLVIRLNNTLVEAFDPFPVYIPDVQSLAESYWQNGNSYIKFQGIVLPKRASEEAKNDNSIWCMPGKSLHDLQGIFVYRNERLISYGGWLRSIARGIHLQFGRVMIEISNRDDSLFHLNVAKSSLKLPFGLRRAMTEMINSVALQAYKEYRDRVASLVIKSKVTNNGLHLITKETTSAGAVLKINPDFELMKQLQNILNEEGKKKLDILIELLEMKLNEVWRGNSLPNDLECPITDIEKKRILNLKGYYEQVDYSAKEIETYLLETFHENSEAIKFIKTLFK